MIDFHTHILPHIDDGSNSVAQSIEMLLELKKQNVQTVVATPHFDIMRHSVEQFAEKREHSFNRLIKKLDNSNDFPEIVLGAEVFMNNNFIYKIENLEKLCIGNTKYILIEMPFVKWDESMYKSLFNITNIGLTPIIAHIDRYWKMQKNEPFIKKLLDIDVVLQINADFINNFFLKHQILKLIKNTSICVFGSDCHNMTTRRPNNEELFNFLQKSLGSEKLNEIKITSQTILNQI